MSAPRDVSELPTCDLILRGGITSGVVYPGTVAGLAQNYRFVSIGGASAGAIAAGVAAAAEYGRQVGGQPDAFAEVAGLAQEVGGATTSLRTLFRATPKLWLLDRLLWLGLRFGAWAALGAAAAPALVLALAAWLAGAGFAWALALLFGGLIATVIGLAWLVLGGLPAAGFGLCPGIHPGIEQTAESLRRRGALMDWMHATIQRLAGRSVGAVREDRDAPLADADRPLTMRDLWGTAEDGTRRIDLLLTTTNLSQQLPHQFPFLERPRTALFFDPAEMARVLPRDVVRWMVRAARPVPPQVAATSPGLLRLPAPEDLPVLLGVRMSLSFPGLIAAVPLHAADYGAALAAGETLDEAPDVPTRRCWFSDGGITSNFPIHLFDSPLPRRPTFCVNLRAATAAEQAQGEAALVWMPERNDQDIAARFDGAFDGSLFGFLGAIVSTARNGHENELMLLPGHRDRIVHVATADGEGGLNLDMGAEVIDRLSRRGGAAAAKLVDRFHPTGAYATGGGLMGWRNHRWIRLRSTLAGLERVLGDIAAAWKVPDPQAGSYADATFKWSPTHPENATSLPPGHRVTPSYRWKSESAADAAGHGADAILALAETLKASAKDQAPPGTPAAETALFDVVDGGAGGRPRGGAPRPKLGLRQRPVGEDPRALRIYR